jgi:hypothetical protein
VIYNQNLQGVKKTKLLRINNPVKKWANELNRQLSKEEGQMVNKYVKNTQHPWPKKKCK